MKRWQQKYKCRISALILIGYVLTFSAGVFHFHKYNFDLLSTFESQKTSANNHFQFLNGKLNDCVIHQNFSSIQTASALTVSNFAFIKQKYSTFPFFEDRRIFSSVYYQINLLRAPPQIS